MLAAVLAALTFRGLSAVWPSSLLDRQRGGRRLRPSGAPGADPDLVPREHLANAITLNSIMLRRIGRRSRPWRLLVATRGLGWVYAINALSFLS